MASRSNNTQRMKNAAKHSNNHAHRLAYCTNPGSITTLVLLVIQQVQREEQKKKKQKRKKGIVMAVSPLDDQVMPHPERLWRLQDSRTHFLVGSPHHLAAQSATPRCTDPACSFSLSRISA